MFTLSIKTDNAAFTDDEIVSAKYACRYEVARILRDVATKLESGEDGGSIRDINGNRVGSYSLTEGLRDHSEPTWQNQLWHARKLLAEKGAEALDNPHAMIGRACGCQDCFCCAAALVLAEHRGAK